MMEMEPFPFFPEDPMAAMAAATAEDFPNWDPRFFSDLVSPAINPPPLLPSEADMFPWAISPVDEYASPLSPPPLPPSQSTGVPLHSEEVWPAALQSAAPAWAPADQHPPTPIIQRGAFVAYDGAGKFLECRRPAARGGETNNIHRRMLEYLRKMPTEKTEKGAADRKPAEGSRCFRHMMRERQRRERLSQSYADLHSLIVPRPKANKNAIVLSAAAYVGELERRREALQQRHRELRASLGVVGGGRRESATINLCVGNPSSPIDSMISALRQLKKMSARARSIRSCAADRELSAVIDVETEVGPGDVEAAVQGALVETERNLRSGYSRPNVDPAAAWTGEWWVHSGDVA